MKEGIYLHDGNVYAVVQGEKETKIYNIVGTFSEEGPILFECISSSKKGTADLNEEEIFKGKLQKRIGTLKDLADILRR